MDASSVVAGDVSGEQALSRMMPDISSSEKSVAPNFRRKNHDFDRFVKEFGRQHGVKKFCFFSCSVRFRFVSFRLISFRFSAVSTHMWIQ